MRPLLLLLLAAATIGMASGQKEGTGETQKLCGLCHNIADKVVLATRLGLVSVEDAQKTAGDLCQNELRLGTICTKAAAVLVPYITSLIRKSNYTGRQLCSILLPPCQQAFPLPARNWSVPLPPIPSSSHIGTAGGQRGARNLRVLQVTDIHIDEQYQPGAEVNCAPETTNALVQQLVICCRGPAAKNSTNAAGPWGSTLGQCDLPYRTFESALRFIQTSGIEFDYVLLTGDFLPHNMWDYSRQRTIAFFRNITRTVEKWLPTTPIYLQLGNHEAVPFDAYSYDDRGTMKPQHWLYEEMEQFVRRHVPEEWDRKELLKHGSYVTYPAPGLKLIHLNNNFCFHFNFFAYLSPRDPGGVLSFLVRELSSAESAGLAVHIHAHIPPTNLDCIIGWPTAYLEILERFRGTVREQFFGHNHYERHLVYLDRQGREVAGGWAAPSITTWDHVNPGFRTYSLDQNYQVVDSSVFSAAVDGLPAEMEPQWQETKTGLEALDVASWYRLIKSLLSDPQGQSARRHYVQQVYRNSPWIQKADSCDDACAIRLLRENIIAQ